MNLLKRSVLFFAAMFFVSLSYEVRSQELLLEEDTMQSEIVVESSGEALTAFSYLGDEANYSLSLQPSADGSSYACSILKEGCLNVGFLYVRRDANGDLHAEYESVGGNLQLAGLSELDVCNCGGPPIANEPVTIAVHFVTGTGESGSLTRFDGIQSYTTGTPLIAMGWWWPWSNPTPPPANSLPPLTFTVGADAKAAKIWLNCMKTFPANKQLACKLLKTQIAAAEAANRHRLADALKAVYALECFGPGIQ